MAILSHPLGLFVALSTLFVLSTCQQDPVLHSLIESEPGNAKVFLDDKYIGNTPVFYPIDGRSHHLKIILTGYHNFEKTVRLSTNLINQRYNLLPVEKPFSIKITPSPTKVYLNGKSVLSHLDSQGILKLSLNLGAYELLAFKEGFPFYRHRFKLSPSSASKIRVPLYNPGYKNRLTIKSPHQGVRVHYQGLEITELPTIFYNLDKKPFQLSFHLTNHQPKIINLTLGRNEKRIINIRLDIQKKSFPLLLEGLPTQHLVSVDYKVVVPEFSPSSDVLVEETVDTMETMRAREVVSAVTKQVSLVPSLVPLELGESPFLVRVNAMGYYPMIHLFEHSNQEPYKLKVGLLKKFQTPSLLKKLKFDEKIYTAKYNGESEQFYFNNEKNRISVYNRNLELIKKYEFSDIKTFNQPQLSYGLLDSGHYLLTTGVVTRNYYFDGNGSYFNEPVYLLENTRKVLVFNNGSHEIRVWEKTGSSLSQLQEITGFDYLEDENLYKLRFGQAVWLPTNSISQDEVVLYTDPLNGKVRKYNLTTREAGVFKVDQDYLLQPVTISLKDNLILTGARKEVSVYFINEKNEGELMERLPFPELASDLRFQFTVGDKLYLITDHMAYLYKI